eukprot:GEMP01096215.1.p1 GENE.GEMP01096215.1~~GEMP01096215.1.p1  ORF type:complete len:112 (+),score=15.79 GEMP01096215.1:61-396(+)
MDVFEWHLPAIVSESIPGKSALSEEFYLCALGPMRLRWYPAGQLWTTPGCAAVELECPDDLPSFEFRIKVDDIPLATMKHHWWGYDGKAGDNCTANASVISIEIRNIEEPS